MGSAAALRASSVASTPMLYKSETRVFAPTQRQKPGVPTPLETLHPVAGERRRHAKHIAALDESCSATMCPIILKTFHPRTQEDKALAISEARALARL